MRSLRFRSSRSTPRRPRGVTIVEILIATAGLVVILGLAWSIYDETQTASRKMIKRQSAIDYSVRVMDVITKLLRDAVAPENLDDPSIVKPVFSRETLSIPAYRTSGSVGLDLVTIALSPNRESGEYYVRIDKPNAHATGTQGVSERRNALGGLVEGFEPTLSFAYALEAAPGRPVDYRDELAEGQWPALIRVTIVAELEEYKDKPVKLSTAVIPGRLPRSKTAQSPADIPAPGQSEPAQPEAETAPIQEQAAAKPQPGKANRTR